MNEPVQPEPAEPEAAEAEPQAEAEPPRRLRDAVRDSFLGLAKLLGLFIPEIVLALIGGVIGLVLGVVTGVVMTTELFSGPGPWARAGPIALIIPALTALGPPIVGLAVGLVVPPALALVPHAAVMAVVARTDWRDRYVVLWAVTVLVWLPALLHVGDGLQGLLAGVLVFSPVTASIGFGGGVLFVAIRGVLAGRSMAGFWRDADGSMVLAMAVLTIYSAAITWFACFLFCLLPTVPVALGLALLLGVRLLVVGRHRGLAFTTCAVNLLHLAVLITATFIVATGDSGGG